jgi:hypothetical protein
MCWSKGPKSIQISSHVQMSLIHLCQIIF